MIRRMYLGKGGIALAHELGHILGCAHDQEHAGDLNEEFYQKRKPYIFGHRFEIEGVTYVAVMGYEPGIYVPYFSNPRLALDSVPFGVLAEQSRPSDGTRTINEIAPHVADYRRALSRVECAEANFGLYNGQGKILLRRADKLEEATQVIVRTGGGA